MPKSSQVPTSCALTGGRGLFNYDGLLRYGPPALRAREGNRTPRPERPGPTKVQVKKAHKQRCKAAHDVLRAMRRR